MSSIYSLLVGTVSTYAAFSALSSAVVEWWSAYSGRRARYLREGLVGLLGEGLGTAVWEHPLVNGSAGTRSPSNVSYIAPDTFAVVLMFLGTEIQHTAGQAPKIRRPNPTQDGCAGAIDERGTQVLESLTAGARSAPEVQDRIQVWFKAAMERVSGIYKRRTQGLLAIVTLVVVVLFNVDTIAMWKLLAATPVAQDAAGVVQLPFGWIQDSAITWQHTGGLLLTWLALVTGGPMWFDLLAKVINPRQTGDVSGDAIRIVSQ